MAPIATGTGALLCILGVLFYAMGAPGHRSPTAFIPLVFGLPIAICGIMARKEQLRRHAMHAAAGLALISLLGSLMGLPKWLTLMRGGAVPRPLASVEQLLMFVISAVFLVLCVRSFSNARRSSEA